MSSEKAPYTSLLEDKKKTELGSLDLFDRIINLKLTLSSRDSKGGMVTESEYVIRSDYETYFPDLLEAVSMNDYDGFVNQKKCYVRKCQYKPSIKVQYKRVSMDVPVEVDIFINNFFMLDKSGKMLKTFNNATHALTKVELAMGYFGQFKGTLGDSPDGSIKAEDLFKFDRDNLKGHGITLITMSNVSYVQTDKLPPDMTVHIHGFVGNLYAEKLQDIKEEEAPKSFDAVVQSKRFISYKELGKDTVIEKTFFEAVTRNWVREGSLPKDTTIKLTKGTTVEGTLSEAEAENYGVKVYLSTEAKKYAEQWDKDHIQIDSEGNKVFPEAVKLKPCATAMAKANEVMKNYMAKEFSIQPITTNGCLLVYKNSELTAPADMLKDTPLEKFYEKDTVATYWKDKLPAVYNITTDALCTISCPFFFFLSPFQKFYFKSRYALGGMVSYYANFNASEDEFYALWQTVSFATVEDLNECTIVCTGEKSN